METKFEKTRGKIINKTYEIHVNEFKKVIYGSKDTEIEDRELAFKELVKAHEQNPLKSVWLSEIVETKTMWRIKEEPF